MNIIEKFKHLFKDIEDSLLTVSDIKNRIWEYDRENGMTKTNETSILPSDYCYNRTNNGARHVHLFSWENGRYWCLGENYKYNGYIYRQPKGSTELLISGVWVNGVKTLYDKPCSVSSTIELPIDSANETTFLEGKSKLVLHKTKEREETLVRYKKQKVFDSQGKLSCEVCGFDFYATYGERGLGYIECHHNIPISSLSDETQMTPEDLSLLCANCHRIIHRKAPWISVNDLKDIIKKS
ncbi:HNH endonuclease [Pseudaeromonas sp. ZJS20]|uniref:HNH endonuclease n=1 Tax=Pseudaeromonas aegiceratis TaxID=3153928 RepID=UPI00390C56BF